MTVRLRPHHLLCLLTYAGKGYSPAFTDNFDDIIERLRAGEPIAVVEGPDDICQPIAREPDTHCLRDSVTVRDRQATRDLAALLHVSPGDLTALPDLATLREAFATGRTRGACRGCEWFDLCSGIAADGFAGTNIL